MWPRRRPAERIHYARLRLTEDEAARLLEREHLLNATRSATIRDLAFGRPLGRHVRSNATAQTIRIWNNLEQLRRWAENAPPETREALERLAAEAVRLQDRLLR